MGSACDNHVLALNTLVLVAKWLAIHFYLIEFNQIIVMKNQDLLATLSIGQYSMHQVGVYEIIIVMISLARCSYTADIIS